MHKFDWNDLRYFLAVSRAGSLAGAARSLGVRHTTVGRRIEALEAALAASLFTRTPDGFILTESGTAIMPFAEQAERAADAVERRVAGGDERVEGVVRVTTSEAVAGFLVRRLSELRARYPDLTVDVLSTNAALNLSRSEADIALRMVPTDAAELVSRRLCDAGWSLYAAESYVERMGVPEDPANLSGHNIVGFDETMARTPGARWLEDHSEGAHVVMRCNSLIAALNATIVGMGVSVVPCFLADAEPTLTRLTGAVLDTREIWVVFHPDVAKIKRVRTVIDFIAEIIARDAPSFRGDQPARPVLPDAAALLDR
jgi:DNA-binding transcriptional LysR family regulator